MSAEPYISLYIHLDATHALPTAGEINHEMRSASVRLGTGKYVSSTSPEILWAIAEAATEAGNNLDLVLTAHEDMLEAEQAMMNAEQGLGA